MFQLKDQPALDARVQGEVWREMKLEDWNTAPVGEELAVYAEVLRVKRVGSHNTHPSLFLLVLFSIMTEN